MQTAEDTHADVALVARLVAHDEGALGELYDRHSRLLFGLLIRVLKHRGDAEEVLQEVFVQAWTRADSYNSALGTPAGWLIGIARNRAIDRLRADAARLRAIGQVEPPPAVSTPETDASISETQRDIRRALEALPPEQRILITHAYFEGLTQSELAMQFSLPLGTVKTRVRAGLLALRGLLARRLIER
jgi:RNA polymerase sigma-70 factor (ECF subfamily)